MPLLRRIHDRRAADPDVLAAVAAGEAFILGEVVADPAYTAGAVNSGWQLAIKALGANPIGRLHRTNQEGVRYHRVGRGKRVGEVMTIGGRPVCECVMHTSLAALRFPKFPFTTSQLRTYQAQIVQLDEWEWAPNGAPNATTGSRQWIAPHGKGPDGKTGGCPHCVDTAGEAILGPDLRPRPRCCQASTRTLVEHVFEN
jgi:hypothetical protein